MAIYSLRMSAVGKTTQKQPFTAGAHLKYITRKTAVTHVMAGRMPETRREALAWLRKEEKDDRKNARVIDKIMVALPRELDIVHQKALVKAFAEELTQGKASWFAAFHTKGKDAANPHCHIILRDRDVATGRRVMFLSAGKKEAAQRHGKGQSAPTTLAAIRLLWERCANAALVVAGRVERIDRRTLKKQGVARPAQVHEGPNIRAMHRRGVRPSSRNRTVRNSPYRSRKAATRIVRYEAIDKGLTRVEYNASLRAEPRLTAERAIIVPVLRVRSTDWRPVAPRLMPKAEPHRTRAVDGPLPETKGERLTATGNESLSRPTMVRMSPEQASGPVVPAFESVAHGRSRIGEIQRTSYGRLMETDLAQAQVEIDAARSAYRDADDALERMAGGIWVDGRSAADWLIEVGEEQGADRAIMHMLGHAEGLGPLGERGTDSYVADMSDTLEQVLECVLVAQDRLDQATAKKDRILRQTDPTRHQVINFGGREFEIDTQRGELRSVDNPSERYRLTDDAMERDAPSSEKLTLTERLAQQAGIEPVQPAPTPDRTRGR